MIENLYLNVGAMKAGTTWLYQQLENHPEISFVPEKELHYFSAVTGGWDLIDHDARIQKFFININNKDFERLKETINGAAWYAKYASSSIVNDEWYQSLFDGVKGKYCADFCNLNSQLDSEGWQRVRQNYTNQLKVTYCLRDPFKRAWSHYKFHQEWIGNGNKIIELGIDEFKLFLNQDWFKKITYYHDVIGTLRENLRDDEFKVFFFEDFRSAPQTTLNQLCSFLGIKNVKAQISKEKINQSQSLKIPSQWEDYLWNFLEPVYASLDKSGLTHPKWSKKSKFSVEK